MSYPAHHNPFLNVDEEEEERVPPPAEVSPEAVVTPPPKPRAVREALAQEPPATAAAAAPAAAARKPSVTSQSNEEMLQEWLNDAVGENRVLQARVAKLEEQLSALKMAVSRARKGGDSAAAESRSGESLSLSARAEAAVAALVRNGEARGHNPVPPNLAQFRTLREKELLLQEAMMSMLHDVIVHVVLFVRSTLTPPVFARFIRKHRAAQSHYFKHLRTIKDTTTLRHLHDALGHKETAVRLRWHDCFAHKADPAAMFGELQVACEYARARSSDHHVQMLAGHMAHHTSVLRRQQAIEAHDSAMAASGREEFYTRFPRFVVLHAPVRTTLYYCYLYHPLAAEDKLSSPLGIKKEYDINDVAYMWSALRSRAHVGDWESVKQLPQKRGFLRTKHDPIVGWGAFIHLALRYRAPMPIIDYFAAQFRDAEEKYAVCRKHQLFSHAIDALVALRDRERLEWFRGVIQSEVARVHVMDVLCKLDAALNDRSIKWKKPRRAIRP